MREHAQTQDRLCGFTLVVSQDLHSIIHCVHKQTAPFVLRDIHPY